MPGKNTADIVFLLDASQSMEPCIEGVKEHILNFAGVFEEDTNQSWDIRLDFLAHQLQILPSGGWKLRLKSVYENELKSIYGNGRFFTQKIDDFKNALTGVRPWGNESTLPALDCALDLPWRDHGSCRRIVIVMTDEQLETGANTETPFAADIASSMAKLDAVINKINGQKVILFLVAPDSEGYEKLASANKAAWITVAEGGGLAGVDFGQILASMAKSITKSQSPLGATPATTRALFGQDTWP